MKMKFDALNDAQKAQAIEQHREINFHGQWYEFEKSDFHEKLEQHGFHDIQSNFTGFVPRATVHALVLTCTTWKGSCVTLVSGHNTASYTL